MEIEQIDQEITQITPLPALVDDGFYAAGNNLYGVELPLMSQQLKTLIPLLNTSIAGINTAATTVSEQTILTGKNATIALLASNYKGDWIPNFEEDDEVGYDIADTVSFTDGYNYISKIKNNDTSPTSKTNTYSWDYIEAVSPEELAKKANTEDVNTQLDKKANTEDVNTELAKKANTEDVNTELAKKANINGSELKSFKVKAAENDNESVNLDQLNTAIASTGFPIGHHFLQIRETPYDNELVEYGGEYVRADFPKLWELIETQTSLLLSDEDWQIENTANGMCGYFSSGDGSTTFRLRNLNEAMFIAVDGVTNAVGAFREGENKNHRHTVNTSYNYSSGLGGGGSSVARHGTTDNTTYEGGDKNTVDRIGALPLIIAK